MPLTEHHLHQARLINDFVNQTFESGGNEEALLRNMVHYLPTFKGLMDTTTSDEMDELCQRFDGFYLFASLLENLASGIAKGDIDVPPEPEAPPSNVHTLLPRLTVNRTFLREFLSEPTPCFALGLVEERQQQYGFLALRPDELIPPDVMNGGFRFGHSLMGSADFEVIHFAFEFYGFGRYNVLLNPNNPVVQAVLDILFKHKNYFFFAIDPNQSITTFRSDIDDEGLTEFEIRRSRIMGSITTDTQYEKAVAQFAKTPDPSGTLLTWVCRDTMDALDLTQDRLEMTPKS